MTREQRIVETLVELADTIVDDFDVVEFLHRLAERCVELLDCAEAGLLLVDAGGALRVMASSSEHSQALQLLDTQSAEGPCFECVLAGRQVFSEDLGADVARWPIFAPIALERGFHSVRAVPMRVRGETVGALNLLRASKGPFPVRDMSLGQGMADIAAIALLQERLVREARGAVQQLQGALSSRVVIEQAKGVVAERTRTSVDAAFGLMRAHARAHNMLLSNVARELLDGRLDPIEFSPQARRRRSSEDQLP